MTPKEVALDMSQVKTFKIANNRKESTEDYFGTRVEKGELAYFGADLVAKENLFRYNEAMAKEKSLRDLFEEILLLADETIEKNLESELESFYCYMVETSGNYKDISKNITEFYDLTLQEVSEEDLNAI